MTLVKNLDRDFVGYGGLPPDPQWPNGARIAVNFVLNYEEGAEMNVLDGDAYCEASMTDAGASNMGIKGRDLAAESMFEFGSRVGFWRIQRIFAERGLPMTIFGCALALERNPQATRAIVDSGHDVCCHGYRFRRHYEMAEDDEREEIRRGVELLARLLGERPYGWYCRYAPGVHTRRLLVEEGGFLYDSNSYADELPYWVDVNGRSHLVIPHSFHVNDNKYARGWIGTADDFVGLARDAFDQLYAESALAGRMLTVSLHPRVSGHPARAVGLRRLLDHIQSHADVWVCRRLDIARHWIERHPPLA